MDEGADQSRKVTIGSREGKLERSRVQNRGTGKLVRVEPFVEIEAGGGETQVDAAGRAGAAQDFVDGADAEEVALFHDGDGGAHFLKVGENVGSDEDGFSFAVELAEEVFEFDTGFGIEARGGFVEDKERRVVNDSPGNAKALLHAAREAVDEGVTLGFKPDLRYGGTNAATDGDRRKLVRASEMINVFPDFEIAVDGEEVGEITNVLLGVFGVALNVDAVDGDGARSGSQQTANHFESGGLAGAVGANETEDFSARDGQREMVGGDEKLGGRAGLVVFLGDVVKADHVLSGYGNCYLT